MAYPHQEYKYQTILQSGDNHMRDLITIDHLLFSIFNSYDKKEALFWESSMSSENFRRPGSINFLYRRHGRLIIVLLIWDTRGKITGDYSMHHLLGVISSI